jgi:DnaJ-class molecular chaperone
LGNAVDLLVQVLELDPGDDNAHLRLVNAQQQLRLADDYQAICQLRDEGLWEAVLEALDDLERRYPNYPGTKELRAWADRTANRQKSRSTGIVKEQEDAGEQTQTVKDSTVDDPFADIFDRFFGNHYSKTNTNLKNKDIEIETDITLEEAFSGLERNFRFMRGGVMREIIVKIPSGVKDNDRIRCRGEGDPGNGDIPGNLYIIVNVLPHSHFTCDGYDLSTNVFVSDETRMRGGEIGLSNIDGNRIKIRIRPDKPDGQVYRVAGQGMPYLREPERRGDLYVKVLLRKVGS